MKNIANNKLLNFFILAIFAALPFERIPTFELGGFTVKTSYLFGIMFLIVFLFSGPIHLFKENRLIFSDWFLILFWIFGVLTLLWTPDFKHGIIISALWAFMFILYLILSRFLRNDDLREKAENILIIVSVLVCLFGLYQFLGDSFGLSEHLTQILPQYSKAIFDFPRIQSTALEPLYFANFLLVPVFLIIKRYFLREGMFNAYFFISVLLFVNITLTISRGAYLALAVSLIVLLVFLLAKKDIKNKLTKIFGLLVIGIFSLAISAAFIKINGSKAASNFVSHSTASQDYSSQDRISTYSQAIELWRVKPVFGNGLGSYAVKATPVETFNTGIYQTVNNEYLEILSETGVTGLLLFLVFLIIFVVEIFRGYKGWGAEKRLSIVLLGLGLLSIFVQFNFFSTLYIIYLWVFLALLKAEAQSEKV